MIPEIHNLLVDNEDFELETFTSLIEGQQFKLEHIVSRGDCSPADDWYDQGHSEWVMLVAGTAILEFETGKLPLKQGDALLIPPNLKHRVDQTSQDAVWIALHYQDDEVGI